MFDLAGGGLAVWSQGVHWTEGTVPGKLHQTHLDISDSARDLVLSTPTVIFCKQLSIFKYFFNENLSYFLLKNDFAGHLFIINISIMLGFADQNSIFALYVYPDEYLELMESKLFTTKFYAS